MKLEQITLREIRMPLLSPFETSFGLTTGRRIILVEVSGEGQSGWGEVTAGEGPFYNEENTDTAWHMLQNFLVPELLSKPLSSAAAAAGCWEPVRENRMAKGGLEAALWDWEARLSGRSLSALLGGSSKEIPCDPGDRMVSHYKLGVLRGGWDIDTPVKELRAKGLIIDNVATRMLSGVTSIDGDIDEKTLRVAKANLSKAFLVADLHRLDDLCSSVLGVFGCPDVLLVRGNEASTDLAPERYELVRAASEELDHLDRQLFEQVRGKLLSMDTEIFVQDGGDPRPYFILTIPFASTVSGVQAIKVEKSRLPYIEFFLRSKLADHDVSVTLPQGHIP